MKSLELKVKVANDEGSQHDIRTTACLQVPVNTTPTRSSVEWIFNQNMGEGKGGGRNEAAKSQAN